MYFKIKKFIIKLIFIKSKNFVSVFQNKKIHYKVDFHKIENFLKILYVYPMKFHIFSIHFV